MWNQLKRILSDVGFSNIWQTQTFESLELSKYQNVEHVHV